MLSLSQLGCASGRAAPSRPRKALSPGNSTHHRDAQTPRSSDGKGSSFPAEGKSSGYGDPVVASATAVIISNPDGCGPLCVANLRALSCELLNTVSYAACDVVTPGPGDHNHKFLIHLDPRRDVAKAVFSLFLKQGDTEGLCEAVIFCG